MEFLSYMKLLMNPAKVPSNARRGVFVSEPSSASLYVALCGSALLTTNSMTEVFEEKQNRSQFFRDSASWIKVARNQ